MKRRQVLTLFLSFLLLLFGGAAIYQLYRGHVLPAPGSTRYQENYVAFYTGVIALQTGDEKRARAQLKLATELAPQEPASWANLGLHFLRAGNFDDAAKNFQKAEELAPKNDLVQALLGVLELRRGNSDAGVAHLRRAVQLAPKNLKARFSLAQELQRRGDAPSLQEAQKLLSAIAQERPQNLAALLELARLAAKQNDAATLKSVVARLEKRSPTFAPEARDQLKELQTALKQGPGAAATPVVFLANVLQPDPAYQAGLSELQPPINEAGQPLEQFLVLAPASPFSSPPDTGLTFKAEALQNIANATTMRAIYLDGADAPAKSDPKPPALFAASAQSIARLDAATPALSGAVAASPDAVATPDWDNDFLPDLVAVGKSGARIFKGDGKGGFQNVTKTVISPAIANAFYTNVYASDLEADGDLDLILGATQAPVVLRNNSDGTFAVERLFANIVGLGAFAFADFDGDNDNDVAALDGTGRLRFFRNDRGGSYAATSGPRELASVTFSALTIADTTRDGVMELLALGGDGEILRVSNGAANGNAKAKGEPWRVETLAKRSAVNGAARLFAMDVDNNGALDLLASDASSAELFLGDDKGFAPLNVPDLKSASVQEIADLNGDGFLDLAGTVDGKPTRFLTAGTKKYCSLRLRPRSKATQGDGRINAFGVGGAIQVRAGLLLQTQPILGPVVFFGLGKQPTAHVARIVWPNGVAQAEFDLAACTSVLAEQRLSGSCPYLWAWNGQSVGFVTDCNWNSPLGLRINAQVTAGVVQTTDWVRVRRDQLVPKNGVYDLRVTADLWEAHYFDEIALLAVDHPADTEMWVDERFSIPPQPQRAQLTQKSQPVKSARDDQGRDVTKTVQTRDANYLDGFGRGRYQGVTRPHWVEVDLSDAPQSGALYLIAEGWLHPTDSSVNVALSQGRHPAPQSVSLQVPDNRGGWRVAAKNLGFPSGKNKTMLFEMSKLFVPNAPRHVRICTNLEIYWDRISWAQPSQVAPRQTRLTPLVADLGFRGFSRIVAKNPSSPELPTSYQPDANAGQRWSDLAGYYTRLGDVRELLKKLDDRYVIMNAGDEMRLTFAALAATPPGWVRDWAFISDGWTKDGNLNTGYSNVVLPYPSHAKPHYDAPPTALRDDPMVRRFPRDWQQFHTRYVAPNGFRNALLPRLASVAAPVVAPTTSARLEPAAPLGTGGEGSRVPVKAKDAPGG